MMKKVILIDDEPLIRQALKKLLERNKLNVEVIGEANNGIEALEWIEREKPDLIFLDIRMPLMDGFELLKKLQAKKIMVMTIILTAFRDFDYATEAIEFGAYGYLVKPIDEKKLIEMVEKVCLKIDELKQTELATKQVNELLKTSYLERLLEGHEPNITLDNNDGTLLELRSNNCQLMIVRSSLTISEIDLLLEQMGSRILLNFQGEIVVVFNHSTDFIDILTGIQRQLGERKTACTFGVSSFGVPLQQLRDAYLKVRACIFYQKATSLPYVYVVEGENERVSTQDFTPDQGTFELFAEKLVLGLNEEARELIRQFKVKLADAMLIDLDLVYQLFFEFVIQIKQRIAKTNLQDRMSIGIAELKFVDIQAYKTLEALSAFFEQMTLEFMPLLQLDETSRMVQKIKTYIQENYSKEVSLHSLAEQLFVSKNYISSIYKQKTGLNFLDYLTQVRMEQAKHRLETTEKGILQIAQEVGYKNASHFGKVFKQEVGTTPAEYRQRIF
ncbi:response regulator [Paenibacillus sp. LMG 31460]|uniref:Response regulator n=1 Tax=Paenibacillus germinis TaxID=2654979 RepID=A0ABX1Z4X4_9BACL|nr:response regulator [Paenibacillus germinis]NOU88278.1 response regulator [Paenibacillus germinis]